MKKILQFGLFVLTFSFLCQGVFAFTVNCEPRVVDIGTGQTFSQDCLIDFACSSGETFPATDKLSFSTDIVNHHWTGILLVDEDGPTGPITENDIVLTSSSNSNPWIVSGGMLSFPCSKYKYDKVTFNLFGYIPLNPSTTMNFVKIEQLDSNNNVILSSVYKMPMTRVVYTPTPEPTSGSISASSFPSGAKIYIDDVYKGITPLISNGIINGGHVVRFKMDGYEDITQVVSISGNTVTASANLIVSTTTAQTTATTTTAQTTTATATTTTTTTTATTATVTTAPTTTTMATTIQTTVPTTMITTTPITTLSTPTIKPTTKATLKKLTPIPMDTPTQASPIGFENSLFAIGFIAFLLIIKR